MRDRSWSITVSVTEDGDRTRADAIPELASRRFHGFGQAKRAPQDPSVAVIGQDLAAARALFELEMHGRWRIPKRRRPLTFWATPAPV